jgi:uncharacterized protein (TIGR00369 family)
MTFQAERQGTCFVCGQENPHGLQMRFELDPGGGAASANWTPASQWEGFRGAVHGGIISAVLDEAMSKAIASAQTRALTGELKVRFRQPVKTGHSFQLRGWIVKRAKRVLEAEAALTDANGVELAHAWGTFIVPK